MTAVSASPVNLFGTSPTTDLFTTPLHINSPRFADEHSGGRSPSSNAPKPSKSSTPKPSASSDAARQNNVKENPTLASDSQSSVPIDEAAIIFSGKDFTSLDSAGITRTTSMSPEMAMQAELDLANTDSKQPEVPGKFIKLSDAIAQRQRLRASSAPTENSYMFFELLNQRLRVENDRFDDDRSGDDTLTPWTGVSSDVSHKPTAQEWASDIDRVSGIVGAMLADDDRGGLWL